MGNLVIPAALIGTLLITAFSWTFSQLYVINARIGVIEAEAKAHTTAMIRLEKRMDASTTSVENRLDEIERALILHSQHTGEPLISKPR